MDDPSKGKGKGLSKGKSVQDLRNQQFLTFSRNDALKFSVWLQVWNVDLFMAILWSGYQKEHLDYSMLLRLSQEDGTLPQGLLSVFFPGMFRGRVLSGLYFAYEAHLYCRSTFRHEGRAFCQRLGVQLGRFLIDPPMDLIPFTFYICFPTTTWDLIVSRFQTSGVLQILAGDVPWTCDSEGYRLINFSFSPRSALYFLLMNLWYHASRGTNFTSGVANSCIVSLRLRMKHFATIFRGGSNCWNRRYLDFLLKVPSTLAINDSVELSTIHTLRSPPDVNLWDVMHFLNLQTSPGRDFQWIGHCLIRRNLYDFLQQPGMLDTWVHPQAFLHFLSPSARQLMLSRL